MSQEVTSQTNSVAMTALIWGGAWLFGSVAEVVTHMSPGFATFVLGILGLALQAAKMVSDARRDKRVAQLQAENERLRSVNNQLQSQTGE